MVNYLWPAFTLVCAIVFNRQKANLLVVPGFVLSMLGICWVLGGDQGLDLPGILVNVKDNPLSYGLAFLGALIWAAYCTVTARIAGGKNGVTLFFVLVSVEAIVYLVLAASAMGFGYAAWNVGILHGNVTVLAGASYFIPVLSAAFAAALLHEPLSIQFWQGALMVCGGSILCWLATRSRQTGTAMSVRVGESS